MKSWSFAQVWNEALNVDRQRELKPRNYVYASELGRGYYDRYWKMKGRKPTTPPGARAQRKFEAGNLTEWVIQQVLSRAGVLQHSQLVLTDEDGPIAVHGRCDFIAGGEVAVNTDLYNMGLPETFVDVAVMAIEKLAEKYPEGLREQGIEIKSCAGVMFERYLKAPGFHHALQAYFYATKTNKPYLLVYVSRDDLRVCQWVIMPNSEQWRELYDKDLETMASVIQEEPEKEPLLTWDGIRFSKNFEVEYSSYLTDYGFERPDLYAEVASSIARRLTNIAKKIREGKPIDGTVNQATLQECYKFYPGAEEIVNKLVKEKK